MAENEQVPLFENMDEVAPLRDGVSARDIEAFIAGLKQETGIHDDHELCLALDEIVHDLAGEGRAALYNGGGADEVLVQGGYTPADVEAMDDMRELDALDDLTSQSASDINNGGLDSQAAYLLADYGSVGDAVAAIAPRIALSIAA